MFVPYAQLNENHFLLIDFYNFRKTMRLKQHMTISLFFSALLFGITKSWIIFTSSLLSGVLIDCDHVLDYLVKFRKRFSLKEFFDLNYNHKMQFVMIIFHSWELLVPFGFYAFFISGNPWIIGISIGFTQHIVLDQIFNKPNRWTYFFFWRLNKGFNKQRIFPD